MSTLTLRARRCRTQHTHAVRPEVILEHTTSLAEVERSHIERVLPETGGNITQAATALGIADAPCSAKLKGYGSDAE